jgi:hypothetical protein
MLKFALAAATHGVEEHRDLPMPPWAFGLVALAGFFVLFLFTWAFRSAGTKHGADSGH